MIGFFHAKIGENTWGTLLEALAVWYSWKVGFLRKFASKRQICEIFFEFRKE